jgi:hypothetical protein
MGTGTSQEVQEYTKNAAEGQEALVTAWTIVQTRKNPRKAGVKETR